MSRCSSPETRHRRDEPARLTKDDQSLFQFANLSSFAEQMLIHEHGLLKIREDMPLDRAALIGCAVTTGVGSLTTSGDDNNVTGLLPRLALQV